MRNFAIVLAAVSFFFGSNCLQAQEKKISLKPQFLVGKKYVLEQAIDQSTKMPTPQGEQNMKMKMKMVSSISITQINPQEKKVEISFDEMVMDMDMGEQKMKMDANDPSQKAVFGPMMEMKPAMIYTNDNEFVRMEGLDAVANPMVSKLMNADSLKQMVNGSLDGMPQEPVAPGHQWYHEVEMPMEGVGALKVATKFNFEKMESVDGIPCAKITFDGIIDGDMSAEQTKITFKDSSITGTMFFDPEIGYIRKQEMRNIMTMKMTVPGQPEMEMPMDQTQILTLRALEDIK